MALPSIFMPGTMPWNVDRALDPGRDDPFPLPPADPMPWTWDRHASRCMIPRWNARRGIGRRSRMAAMVMRGRSIAPWHGHGNHRVDRAREETVTDPRSRGRTFPPSDREIARIDNDGRGRGRWPRRERGRVFTGTHARASGPGSIPILHHFRHLFYKQRTGKAW
jgi:hypothetical protein